MVKSRGSLQTKLTVSVFTTAQSVKWQMQGMLVKDKMLVMSQMNPWCDFTHFIRVIPRINLSQCTVESPSFEQERISACKKTTVLPWVFKLDCKSIKSDSKWSLLHIFDAISQITYTVPESVAWSRQQHGALKSNELCSPVKTSSLVSWLLGLCNH